MGTRIGIFRVKIGGLDARGLSSNKLGLNDGNIVSNADSSDFGDPDPNVPGEWI